MARTSSHAGSRRSPPRSVLREYDSFDDYLAAVLDAAPEWKGRRSSEDKDASFHGTRDFSQAVRLVREGWPEGRDRLIEGMEAAALVTPSLPMDSRRMDVAGAYPVAALAACGDPMSMVDPGDLSAAKRPVVRLAFSFSYSCGKRAQEVEDYGSALLSWIDRIEESGRSVEVMACHLASASGWRFGSSIVVKRAGEPLEIDRVAFVVGHPAFLRRIHFRAYEREGADGFEDAFAGGYGMPETRRPTDLDPSVHWLPGPQDYSGRGVRDAVEFLRRHVESALDDPFDEEA